MCLRNNLADIGVSLIIDADTNIATNIDSNISADNPSNLAVDRYALMSPILSKLEGYD